VAGSEGTIEFVRPTLRQRREGWGTRESFVGSRIARHFIGSRIARHFRWFTNCRVIFVGSRIARPLRRDAAPSLRFALATYNGGHLGLLGCCTQGCAHLGIWLRVLEGALILLCEEIHAETAGYYDCGCGVAGEL
jgi:hypothetical protein